MHWNRQKRKTKFCKKKKFYDHGYEKDIRISDKITNTQPDTTTYSKTITDIQEDQPNKGATKKSMIQQTLLQSYAYTRKRSCSLGESISERDLVNEGYWYFKTKYTQFTKDKYG